jgi:hypothetical protein
VVNTKNERGGGRDWSYNGKRRCLSLHVGGLPTGGQQTLDGQLLIRWFDIWHQGWPLLVAPIDVGIVTRHGGHCGRRGLVHVPYTRAPQSIECCEWGEARKLNCQTPGLPWLVGCQRALWFRCFPNIWCSSITLRTPLKRAQNEWVWLMRIIL